MKSKCHSVVFSHKKNATVRTRCVKLKKHVLITGAFFISEESLTRTVKKNILMVALRLHNDSRLVACLPLVHPNIPTVLRKVISISWRCHVKFFCTRKQKFVKFFRRSNSQPHSVLYDEKSISAPSHRNNTTWTSQYRQISPLNFCVRALGTTHRTYSPIKLTETR
jgi:hypothetical protein